MKYTSKIKEVFLAELKVLGVLLLLFFGGMAAFLLLAKMFPYRDRYGEYVGVWGSFMFFWGTFLIVVIVFGYPVYFLIRYVVIPLFNHFRKQKQ